MKRSGLLHAETSRELAALGHTQSIVIADAGLPVPRGVRVIDLAVRKGLPGFREVLEVILGEAVFEKCLLAEEIKEKNSALHADTLAMIAEIPREYVLHEEFKRLSAEARVIIRTGEATSFANVILIGGVNF